MIVRLFNHCASVKLHFFTTKFAAVLFICCTFFYSNTFAQKISLEDQETSIKNVLQSIEKKTAYTFMYDAQKININKRVHVHAQNREVRDVLNEIFAGDNIAYEIKEHQIVLYAQDKKKSEKPEAKAQQTTSGKVSGKIVDAQTGEALIGVNVVVKGTSSGTITDINGNFQISAKSNDVLIVTYIGYATQQINVGTNKVFSIKLEPQTKAIEEVVVVGYGSKRKIDLTGTVNSIDNNTLVSTKAPNMQQALQGQLAGVDVKRASGKPGADTYIEIRGVNSISGNTQPLYVIDGVPTGGVNDINPADIERIDILKDASSTAIYGSRGSNGVVLVTTKRGSKDGKFKITYDGYVGAVSAYNLPRMMNGPEFVQYARDFYKAKGDAATPAVTYTDANIFSATELQNITNNTYTDWINLIKQTGFQTNHLISLTGGDAKTSYFGSVGYQYYEGATKGTDQKKYTLKVGIDKTINNTFRFGASAYLTYTDYNPGSGEIFRSAYRLRPTGSAYNNDGSKRFFTYEGESQITNPLFDLENEVRRTQTMRIFPNVYGEINFIKDLKFRSSFTPDISFSRAGYYYDTYTKTGAGTKPAGGQYNTSLWVSYSLDNTLNYSKKIGQHKFDVLLGNSVNQYVNDWENLAVTGLPYRSLWYNLGSYTDIAVGTSTTATPKTVTLSTGYYKNTIASFMTRVNYSFANRYLLTLTGRYDGNSVLADGHKWKFFPSIGGAWILSEEKFMQPFKFINMAKVRLSYGESGNAATVSAYSTQVTLSQTAYDWNGTSANGFAPNSLGNRDLTWEKASEYNAGLDLNVLGNRIALQLDYYNKTSKGSILTQQIPAENMFSSTIANIGSVRNSGIEVTLNTVNVKSSNFTWSSNINFSINKNKILSLYGDNKDDIGNAWFLGQKVRVTYNYKVVGVWQTSEASEAAKYGQLPGQWKIQDTDKNGVINSNDRVIIGSDIPTWFGGITNTFSYKGIDLSFNVYTRQGVTQRSTFFNQFVNGDQGRARFNSYKYDYWTSTNPSNKWANLGVEQDGNRRTAAEYINASYTKIGTITLGYTLPKTVIAKLKLTNLRVYATAFNPFIFTNFIGWDPETASNDSYANQDFRTRTLMFGVNLSL